MPMDNQGRWVLSQQAYVPYLEKLLLAAIEGRGEFDEIVVGDEHFCLYNIREAISRQREYRCQVEQNEQSPPVG